MRKLARRTWTSGRAVLFLALAPIQFTHAPLPFTLENREAAGPIRYTPATMAGGVAMFDYDRDGDLDLFFANGAEIPSFRKTSPNRLLANDGAAHFTDVTEKAGLAGAGYDTGAAVADYDSDGDQDLFVAGVHRNTLYRNNGDGTFTDVTRAAGLGNPDPWAVAGAWFDYNNDGRPDLFVVNYLNWDVTKEKPCPGYCHPQTYDGLPNRLYRNNGDGTFADVSAESGIQRHVGKGMGAAVADFDGDGWMDVFVTNDKLPNFLFRNRGNGRFEEVALASGVALADQAQEISGMGADARDVDNDGLPDIFFVALDRETFPLFRNLGKGRFAEVTNRTGLAYLSKSMGGYAPGIFDFDNDGWKDLFVSRGHVQAPGVPGNWQVDQPNTVFRNVGGTKFTALTEEAGFDVRRRHRGAAFGDLNGDGRIDAVVTALNAPAELWLNESPGANHWLMLDVEGIGGSVKIVTARGAQYNHVTTSTGYASSSAGPVHFGLGDATTVDSIEVRWPTGAIQRLGPVKADQMLKVPAPSRPGRP